MLKPILTPVNQYLQSSCAVQNGSQYTQVAIEVYTEIKIKYD